MPEKAAKRFSEMLREAEVEHGRITTGAHGKSQWAQIEIKKKLPPRFDDLAQELARKAKLRLVIIRTGKGHRVTFFNATARKQNGPKLGGKPEREEKEEA